MNTRFFEASDGWIRVVPRGFSWVAFFFGPLWAFANRGWLLGVVSMLAATPVEFLARAGETRGALLAALGALTSLTFMVVSGRYGRIWLAWSLKKQGYKEIEPHAV